MDSIEQANAMGKFRKARRKLPIRTESLTQLGRGSFTGEAFVLSGSDAFMYYSDVSTTSSMLADLRPDHTGIVLPLSWRGKCVLNGEQADSRSIYSPVDNTLFEAYGGERKIAAIAVSRQALISTLAALRGVGPDEVQLPGGSVEVPRLLLKSSRRQLVNMLARYRDADRRGGLPVKAVQELSKMAFEMVCDLYLHARPAEMRKSRAGDRLGSTVRKAEECFAAGQGSPVSLADLCAAAGVSHDTLYSAFTTMCGSSPMEYFKKRRLTNAREELLAGSPERGAVKRAALNVGLTHLGRFSTEYRALFGESPSSTLHRPPY